MRGVLIGPPNAGKRTLLSSLPRSMSLKGNNKYEFIGQNESFGDLNPPILRWLENEHLNFEEKSQETVLKFTIHSPKKRFLHELIFFWQDHSFTTTTCLSINLQENTGYDAFDVFPQNVVDHLKQSEYLIICDSTAKVSNTNPEHHEMYFQNLAHLFLQMYQLECSLKRVAFILTNRDGLESSNKTRSPIDLMLDVLGTEFFSVFKTFCPTDTTFGFFVTEALETLPESTSPRSLDDWVPHNTIDPFLYAVRSETAEHQLTILELEVKCKK